MVQGRERDRQAVSEEMPGNGEAESRWLTVPNILCALRLFGSLGIFVLAIWNEPLLLLVLFGVLTVTDWLDGKLAVWLDQRSTFGARLDSMADATMYAGVLFGGLWLKGHLLLEEWAWMTAAVMSYAVSCVFALVRYRRLPSYHTRSAKIAWVFMVAAVVAVFLEWSVWPLRVAMLVVLAANLEAIAITMLLPTWRANVPSVWEAKRSRCEGLS